MRRIVIAVMGTISSLALLFSYHTSTNSPSTTLPDPVAAALTQDPSLDEPDGEPVVTDPIPTPEAFGEPSASPSPEPAEPAKPSGTFKGDTVPMEYGPVKVQITVEDGRIVASDAIVVPMENHHDQVLNSEAVPLLNQMTVERQGHDVDNVSGVTYTSDAYKESLQSAIDKANL